MTKDVETESYLHSLPALRPEEFEFFANFVEEYLGIKMPDTKQTMLQARLQSRLRALKMHTYKEYINYAFSPKHGHKHNAEEIVYLINAVTTNKTEFFRESDHFSYLMKEGLPMILNRTKDIKIWSAGCSTGEEPYTLCMVMERYKESTKTTFNYSVLATDISTRVLEVAKTAVYPISSVASLSDSVRQLGLLRSKDKAKEMVRVKPNLRSQVKFKRLNFMDETFDVEMFHIIFCRNVLIYFEKPTQEKVISKLCQHLHKDGLLFLGHSETVMGMNLPLKNIAPTTYSKI